MYYNGYEKFKLCKHVYILYKNGSQQLEDIMYRFKGMCHCNGSDSN